MEQALYAQVFMPRQKDLNITEENRTKNGDNSSSGVSIQDHSVGLILILIGLRKILAYVNLIYIRKYFKIMMKHRIQIHLKYL